MQDKFKKGIAILGTVTLLGAGSFTPIDLKWTVSYETYLFDTISGDLEEGQFAILENGENDITFYRPFGSSSESESFFVVSEKNPIDLKSYTQVNIIGKAYYDEFTDVFGKKYRYKSDAQKYASLAGRNPVNPTKTITLGESIIK